MPDIELRAIACAYANDRSPTTPALRGLDLRIEHGTLLTVLGTSGSGKTTLLRLIAGLEQPTAGEVRFDDIDVNELPAAQRDLGMVFQSPALFPHLTVRDNLSLGLVLRKTPSRTIRESVDEIAGRLGLEALLGRLPGQLSGGEQQRVALGRAIIRKPKILLLDEPLTHLDSPLRRRLRADIQALHRQAGLTTLLVSHDLDDIPPGDAPVAILARGRIIQTASLEQLQTSPVSPEVADLVASTPPVQ